jgi:predicted nucleic acid-binding protein
MIVVSNTSPIVNLAAVGRLDLLQQLYSSNTFAKIGE